MKNIVVALVFLVLSVALTGRCASPSFEQSTNIAAGEVRKIVSPLATNAPPNDGKTYVISNGVWTAAPISSLLRTNGDGSSLSGVLHPSVGLTGLVNIGTNTYSYSNGLLISYFPTPPPYQFYYGAAFSLAGNEFSLTGGAPIYSGVNAFVDSPAFVTELSARGQSNLDGFLDLSGLTGITSIGYMDFYGCTALSSVSLPPNVTTIGASAFAIDFMLTSITFPASVVTIADHAFETCASLNTVNLNEGLRSIGVSAFDGASFTSITFPSTLVSVGASAFADNSVIYSTFDLTPCAANIQSFDLSAIPYSALTLSLTGCTNLVFTGIAATSIGNVVYDYSVPYTAATAQLAASGRWQIIPEPPAFYSGGAHYLNGSEFAVSGGVFGCYQTAGYIFNPEAVYLFYAANDQPYLDGSIDLSACINLTTVSSSAFTYCAEIPSVKLPASVTSIGSYAFGSCTALSYVNFSDLSLVSIGTAAFVGSSLAAAPLSEGLVYIGASAFGTCPSLTSVNFPASLVMIDSTAFNNCYALSQTIDLSGCTNLTSIGDDAFSSSGILGVVFSPSITNIGANAFNLYGVVFTNLPAKIVTVGDHAFDHTGVSTLDLSACTNLTSIGPILNTCTSLSSITLSSSITNISTAFSGCTSLTSLDLTPCGSRIKKLDMSGSSIVTLNITGCTNLTIVNATSDGTVTDIGLTNPSVDIYLAGLGWTLIK